MQVILLGIIPMYTGGGISNFVVVRRSPSTMVSAISANGIVSEYLYLVNINIPTNMCMLRTTTPFNEAPRGISSLQTSFVLQSVAFGKHDESGGLFVLERWPASTLNDVTGHIEWISDELVEYAVNSKGTIIPCVIYLALLSGIQGSN